MMDQEVYISICIPAYKRTDFLKRLLDSISIQTYRFFEVIVTDDSPGIEVQSLCEKYGNIFPIRYFKNPKPLGMPENWNEGIRKARGEWIKIMHDDDWFSVADALEKFARVAREKSSAFVFSCYTDVFLNNGEEKRITPSAFRLRQLKKEPVTLLSRNIIGPPSVMMHRNDGKFWYDDKLKWLVDIDLYIRRLKDEEILYLPEPLIKVGIGNTQVTAFVHGASEIEIPEHFHFLEKTGIRKLENILVYDYWWRFFRNFSVRDKSDIELAGYRGPIHPVLLRMISWQRKIPVSVLRQGILSKSIMCLHFLLNRKRLSS